MLMTLYIFSNSVEETITLKKEMGKVFQIRDLGPVSECLGMRVVRSNGTIKLDQEVYIRDILEKLV